MNRLRVLAGYIGELDNWLAVSLSHIQHRPPPPLRLRGGRQLQWVDARVDVWAFRSIFLEHCYDRDFSPVRPDGAVVDLGAHVGIFTVYAATRLVPRGWVLAVEPSPACFAKLTQNVGSCPNVTLWQGAVCGTGELWIGEDSLGASTFRSSESRQRVAADTISAEGVLRHFPCISLLKANMEGAEYPFVLETGPELWQNVECVAIKWHDGEIARGHKPDELARRLEAMGFAIVRHEQIWHTEHLTTGITTAALRRANPR